VTTEDGPVQGITAGIRDDGSLLVDVNGHERDVVAGEVEWL
jgi:hypothetical protein